MSKKDTRFLDMARGVATLSTCRYRHGALVVKHSKVLGASPNILRNNPRYVDYRFSSVHAEVAALRKAGWPHKATVYVARINALGASRLSRPCPNCQAVLNEYRCRVVWTVSE